MISSRVRNDNATGFGHGLILDRIQGPPELQLYREEMELLKQQKALSEQPPPLLLQHPQQQQQQHDEQPSQQPLQQPQQQHQHQEPNWSTNDVPREHQGAPVTQLGDDKDLPEQQADPSEKAKVPSTIEVKIKFTQQNHCIYFFNVFVVMFFFLQQMFFYVLNIIFFPTMFFAFCVYVLFIKN